MMQGLAPEKIVYQDEFLLVVNKDSGILSIPDGYDPHLPSLPDLLQPQFGKVWVVHRLDKETSGLMVFCRSAEAHTELNRQFREREVEKQYLALARPLPTWQSMTVSLPLRINAGRSHLTKVDPLHGKAAQTHFKLKESKKGAGLFECFPQTGYRHQIRAHFYAQGIQIIGDKIYKPIEHPQIIFDDAPRLMLQAQALGFCHPLTAKKLSFALEADPAMMEYWQRLNPLL
ncbi:MAG: RluA family pseudouridine synthase [Anaerolineaceae bacterium]|nr:RluA family pseudouridine synthase [Anaerolineaceae bacterium]